MKVVEQKTLVKRRWSYKVRSSAEPWQTLFLFLWPEQDSARNKQNKQDEWMIQGLAFTCKTMDDYRNSLTIKFCADLFPAHKADVPPL